jgi:hypothetical protein
VAKYAKLLGTMLVNESGKDVIKLKILGLKD